MSVLLVTRGDLELYLAARRDIPVAPHKPTWKDFWDQGIAPYKNTIYNFWECVRLKRWHSEEEIKDETDDDLLALLEADLAECGFIGTFYELPPVEG